MIQCCMQGSRDYGCVVLSVERLQADSVSGLPSQQVTAMLAQPSDMEQQQLLRGPLKSGSLLTHCTTSLPSSTLGSGSDPGLDRWMPSPAAIRMSWPSSSWPPSGNSSAVFLHLLARWSTCSHEVMCEECLLLLSPKATARRASSSCAALAGSSLHTTDVYSTKILRSGGVPVQCWTGVFKRLRRQADTL
jgi:hypothetical protein